MNDNYEYKIIPYSILTNMEIFERKKFMINLSKEGWDIQIYPEENKIILKRKIIDQVQYFIEQD